MRKEKEEDCHQNAALFQVTIGEVGAAQLTAHRQKLKTEAERLDIMDKAAGVLAELLFDGNILQQIKEHRTLFIEVSYVM